MINGVFGELIKEGHEPILNGALRSLSPGEVEELEGCGVDARRAFLVLMEYLSSEDNDDIAFEILDKAAYQWSEKNVPWTSMAALIKALSESVFDLVAGKGEEVELCRFNGELVRAQTRLFGTYLDKERQRRERMEKCQREIDAFPDTIAATMDPDTLAKNGMRKLKIFVSVERCALFMIDEEKRLILKEGDLIPAGMGASTFHLEGPAADMLLGKGEPYVEEVSQGDSCLKSLRAECDLGSILLVPIVVRGRTTGIILLSGGIKTRHFTQEEIEIAGRFSKRMAVAMENAHLHFKEQYKIKETVALLEIARVINSTLDLHQILERVVRMTVDLCGVVLCVIYLLEEEGERFVPGAYFGFIEDVLWEKERLRGFELESLKRGPGMKLVRGEPVVSPSRHQNHLLPDEVMSEHGIDSVLMLPLNSKNRLTGIFALFYSGKPQRFEREETEVVGAIAAQASMAIENAALYEDIEKSYFSTVKALAKAIEVKDPYTHGHSERVTEFAMMIAEAMKMQDREKQKLKYAATLHDIGKIGIAGRVLNKPGALTDEEYTHVKTHPLLGDTIIEPVEFLQGPRPIILHHHERYDGKGYPDGLKGTDIPLGARILSVADAYEAMRSDRPYRKALSLEASKEELRRNSGTQFDPQIVLFFLDILERDDGGLED